eukprot:9286908-Pyramimonas_sp.AAC.1
MRRALVVVEGFEELEDEGIQLRVGQVAEGGPEGFVQVFEDAALQHILKSMAGGGGHGGV